MTDDVSNDLDALESKAKKYYKQKEYFAAIETFQEIINTEENRVSAHLGLAAAAFCLDDYELAAQHYDRVTKLAPMNGAALINLGAVYNRLERFQEAATVLRKGMQRERSSATGYFNMAYANRKLNQLSLAISSYREAIRIEPEFVDAYLNLGDVYLDMKNFSQAMVQFKKVLELDPDNQHAMRSIARTDEASSQSKNSISPFGRLVTENQLAANKKLSEVRELTEEERIADRQAVFDLGNDLHRLASDFLKISKENMGIKLTTLTRAVLQAQEGSNELFTSTQQFNRAYDQFQEFKTILHAKSDLLRKHDETMR